ncbi:MAG: hypothetical protein GX100_09480, partial [candidate division WS1 bacterium]|nr:hypothetical protein [candidate division WS1 bacterium]
AMKSLLSSLTPTEREALATPAGFVVGDTLEAERSRELLPLMIWAWKDEATRHGGDYPIMICYHLVMACRGLTERTALGEQVMPWVEDALGKRDGGRDRDWAIASLVEGYRFLGDHAKAIERGEYWLAQGAPRSVGALGLHRSEYCVALALEDRESGRAAQLLRRVAENGTPGTANLGQLVLIRLRLAQPVLTGVKIITPRLHDISVWNAESVATRRIGVPVQEAVLVRGNVTLLVTGASCDLPDSSVSIGEKVRADGTGYLREVLVSAPGFDKVGVHQGTLAVSTNDPERREVTLTLRYAVTEPVGVAPSRLFFGYVTVGECKRCSVRIAGTVPFEVTGVSSELAENLEVKLARTGDTHWLLESTLRAGVQTGVVEGAIELETTLKSQPVIKVRYYAFIRR